MRKLIKALKESLLEEDANVTWKQISMQTKMACGARDATSINNGKDLVFKVARSKYILVEYDRGADEYNVELFRYKKGSNFGEKIVEKRLEGIQADSLNDTIYHLVNK
jgi:hypothetical protein